MKPRIAVLPGDGVGPEVTSVARRVLTAAGLEAQWSKHPIGWSQWTAHGDPLPPATLEACRSADAVLFGAITSKPEREAETELDPALRGRGLRYASPIVRLRRQLELYANVRPARGNGLDLVVFRENTEGLYCGHEASPVPPQLADHFPGLPAGSDAAVSLRLVTREAATRICRAAFDHAQREGRRRVSLAEKANVLRATGGLMREAFWAVAAEHSSIEAEELHVDAACARIISHPAHLDVVVTSNLFGDILSDVAAAAAGGLALAASANLGDRHALFEPVHGSAPDVAGTGHANPLGAVRAGAMMARHLGQARIADRVEAAVDRLIAEGTTRTPDLGGSATTAEVEARLLEILQDPLSADAETATQAMPGNSFASG